MSVGSSITSVADQAIRPLGANRDLLLVFALIGILFAIVVPMPAMLMDVCLIFNLTLAVLILVTTIYVRQPLEFSVFPSLLLVTTLYRLSLNIATTRMILGEAGVRKELAAGGVVHAFGSFVAGNHALVGFIIFVVIVFIQFVVITKGATRIAEVAARFTLDKLPGQQLSIDADLNAGLIDEHGAQERRETLAREADFYGAMDGASKFVRGDAIAGLFITGINIVAGLALGMIEYGFTFDEAVRTFTVLTIGDGLVSQIPALIIAIAAGLLVTRSGSESNLGHDLVTQVFSHPRAIWVAGGFLLLLIPAKLPAWALVFGAAAFGTTAFFLARAQEEEAEDEEALEDPEPAEASPAPVALSAVDPLELQVGYALVRLVDPPTGEGLLTRVTVIRDQIAAELGIVVPPVRIRDNTELSSSEYRIRLRGERVGAGTISSGRFLAMDNGQGLDALDGIVTRDPTFGIPAVWINETQRAAAIEAGYSVVDGTSVLATHLTEVIRHHASELLTREELSRLLDRLREDSPAVVEEVVPDVLRVGEVQKVLQNLLREKVSVRDLEAILECLGDWGTRTRDPEILTEYVRQALGRHICRQFADESDRLYVVTIDPELEETVAATEKDSSALALRLAPDLVGPLVSAISRVLEDLMAMGHPPVVLTAPESRRAIWRMLENQVPGVAVLSYNEVARGISVESTGMARLESGARSEPPGVPVSGPDPR